MKNRKLWIWIGVALLLVLAVVRISQRAKAKGKVELPIAVRIQPPRTGEAFEALALSGTISAEEEANAYSKVPGKLVRYIRAEGDRVSKDETLAWVERDEPGLTYSLSPVKSPLTGLVAQRLLDIGESVAPAMGAPGTPILVVVNPNRLEVVVNVVEKDAPRVVHGQAANLMVEAYPGEEFPGEVARVAPVVDRQSRTTRVVIALQSSGGKLRSGMFAEVRLIVGHKPQGLFVPTDALLKQNQQYFVYLAHQGRAVRRDVSLGWVQGAETEIVSGLAPADQVVVEGQTRLAENSRIQTVAEGR